MPKLAMDPPVSEAQRRAMFAAAEGRSTLGISKKVGEEFIGKPKANDMAPSDWRGLIRGLLRFFQEEAQEPEHQEEAEDSPSGALSEAEKAEADKNAKAREAQPEGVFLEPGPPPKYPVKTNRDGVWKYDRDLLLAAAREARMHGHAELAERADKIRKEEFGGAQDSLIALDRDTVRSKDIDGHLHVASSVVSAAQVNEYLGREIPGWQKLGLNPEQRYSLLRDPVALETGAATLHGKPVVIIHRAQTADDHDREIVVGTVTNPIWESPNLKAETTIWDGDAINAIESGEQQDWSAGYHYVPVMEPGNYNGTHFDGKMTDIIFNHLCLVRNGRVTGAVVGDSKENLNMPKTVLTRKGALVQGALTAYLAPLLAQDAKIDLVPAIAGITNANFKTERAGILGAVTRLVSGKLAKDAKIDGLDRVLMALDAVEPEEKAEDESEEEKDKLEKMEREKKEADDKKAKDKAAKDKKAHDKKSMDELKEKLKDKMSAQDWKAACDDIDGMDDEEDDDDKDDKTMMDRRARDAEMVEKKDMAKAMDEAISGERKRQRDVREAERFVRPWVGDLAIAMDTAEEVYKSALEVRGVSTKGVHPSAYRTILELTSKPGAEHQPRRSSLAMDSAQLKSFADLYPDAMKIKLSA